MTKDLFGNKVPQKRPKYSRTLERFDKRTFWDRLNRLQWLQSVYPKVAGFMMSPESAFIFKEAKMTFINGDHIATLLLANSFIEQWLGSRLATSGNSKLANAGLAKITEYYRTHHLINEKVLDLIDELRSIRNPFVHLKPVGHNKRIMVRAFEKKMHFAELLEEDAKRALTIMYQISISI